MKRRTIVIIVASVAVLTIGGAFAAFYVGRIMFRQMVPKPATEADRRLVVTAQRLHEFGGPQPKPEHERFTVQRFFGSANIEYEYELPEGTPAEEQIYIQSSLHATQNAAEAIQTHALTVVGVKGGLLAADGVELAPAPNLLEFGDQKYAARFMAGGKPHGNVFIVRQGRIVHMLLFSGLYFDDPKEVTALMKPMVDEAEKQFARKR